MYTNLQKNVQTNIDNEPNGVDFPPIFTQLQKHSQLKKH